jgi:hypothetical protein
MKLTLEQGTTTENTLFFCKCTAFSCQLLIIQPLSILCRSLRDIDTYTTGFPLGTNQGQANIFRAVKRILPGPVRISASSQWTTGLYFTNNISVYSCSVHLYFTCDQGIAQAMHQAWVIY